jgi:hypothetical protein
MYSPVLMSRQILPPQSSPNAHARLMLSSNVRLGSSN